MLMETGVEAFEGDSAVEHVRTSDGRELENWRALRALGRADEGLPYARMGLKRAEEALRKHPESSRPAQLGATALAAIGEGEEARRWIERALAIDPDDTHIKYNAACVWAQIGEADKAFEQLEQWAAFSGRENREWMLHDPDLNALRGDPRHQHILDLIDARIAAVTIKQPQPIS